MTRQKKQVFYPETPSIPQRTPPLITEAINGGVPKDGIELFSS
jgi:hypothetical protein